MLNFNKNKSQKQQKKGQIIKTYPSHHLNIIYEN